MIDLMTVESAKLVVDAPLASVKLNLRSLHDSSYLRCAQAEIIVNEGFDKCLIYDQKQQKVMNSEENTPQEDAPVLAVMAEKGLKVTVMSDFELLRRRIMDGMATRRKQ
jgi:hypothetical protein